MKRSLRLIALVCALLLCVIPFTACSDKEPADGSNASVQPPLIKIDTDGVAITTKETYVAAKISTGQTDEEYILTDEAAEVRLRGNYSLKPDKKSYRIKFQTKQNLFGQDTGEARNWLLIANFCDKTLLRNYLAYNMASKLDGLSYTTSTGFVEVEVNGEYQGLYLLAEQVQINEHRVNVEEGSEDPNTGYLLELDRYLTEDGDPSDVDFRVNEVPYAIKNSTYTEEQKIYISNYMQLAFSAVQSGDRAMIESYIDLNSCIDMYIMHEYFKNPDAGYSSFYFFKPKNGKLHFGPVWDFDLGAGNDQRMDNGDPNGAFTGISTSMGWLENHWFTTLMKQSWFKSAVQQRWMAIQPIVEETIALATETTEKYRDAIDRNFEKWPIYGTRQNQEPEHVAAMMTAEEHLENLTDWMTKRKTWFSLYLGGLAN